MNKYYCTKCNAESVIFSAKPELTASCGQCETTTSHRLLSLKGKPNPTVATTVKKAVEVPAEVPAPAPKPMTKLDVSSGPVKSVLPSK